MDKSITTTPDSASDTLVTCRLVGSGAVRANPKRGGTSQLIQFANSTWLVDCGRASVHTLANMSVPVETIDQVFISHLHFDHICDLPLLVLLRWNNGAKTPLQLVGPPGLRQFLDIGVRQAYHADITSRLDHGKDPAGIAWEVHEIQKSGLAYSARDISVNALFTNHAEIPNINYCFDISNCRFGITSDTSPDETLVDFYRGCGLLICECSGTNDFLSTVPWGHWHMNPQAVAELASKSAVTDVVIKHLVIEDWCDDEHISERMAASIRQKFAGRVHVGCDGMGFDLSPATSLDPIRVHDII